MKISAGKLAGLALELAAKSGVKYNGVLCGRATWKDGVAIFAAKGDEALRDWLQSEGEEHRELESCAYDRIVVVRNLRRTAKCCSPVMAL